MNNRFDEIKGEVEDGKLVVTEWPKVRVSNPNALAEEFARYEEALKRREQNQR